MESGGLFEFLRRRYLADPVDAKDVCEVEDGGSAGGTGLGYKALITAFLILVGGGVIALLISLVEKCFATAANAITITRQKEKHAEN